VKLLAFNGSSRGDLGNTDRILQPFLRGAREAGAETEVIYLKEKKINHCTGCLTCWSKTPGACVYKDDMPGLLEKVRRADILLYATPLYIYTVSGLMKNFMDRIIPLISPQIVKRGDQYIHPMRYQEEWPKKLVLISSCAYPERHHFSGLLETMRLFTSGPDFEFAAAILCPAGDLLKVPELQASIKWYLEAALLAGQEVVRQGYITPETQSVLNRNLIDPEVYSRMACAFWKNVRAGKDGAAELR